MPNQTVRNGLKAKKIKLPQNNFFLKKQLKIKFSCIYWPFHSAKFLKNSYGQSRIMRMCHFWAQNGPFVMNKIILVQTIIITFIYLLALLTVHNLKTILQRIQSYEDGQFFGPKWLISPNEIFFSEKLLMSLLLSFMPIYMPKIKVIY